MQYCPRTALHVTGLAIGSRDITFLAAARSLIDVCFVVRPGICESSSRRSCCGATAAFRRQPEGIASRSCRPDLYHGVPSVPSGGPGLPGMMGSRQGVLV